MTASSTARSGSTPTARPSPHVHHGRHPTPSAPRMSDAGRTRPSYVRASGTSRPSPSRTLLPTSAAPWARCAPSGHEHRTVKEEIRANLLARLRCRRGPVPGDRRLRRHRAPRARAGAARRPRPRAARRARAGQDPADPHPGRACSTSGRRSRGHRAQRAPVRPGDAVGPPAGRRARRRDAGRAGWHRSERYGEKLATPDTSVGDLIGDVDPIKVAEGRTLGDPETVHYGLVPRTNRGIFAVNELPDLAERIQVSLLNVLEERDIQVRGYRLRLPLDLLLVASANPEDYTNRGRIITPLKDRFGAEIRTHYPLRVSDEVDAGPAGGRPRRASCPSTSSRSSPASPARSASRRPSTRGPGSRPASRVAATETVAASALRRSAITGEAPAVARVCDLPSVVADAPRQGRVRGQRGGPRDRGARAPAASRGRRDVPGPARRRRPGGAHRAVRGRRHRRDRRPGDGCRAARAGRPGRGARARW